MHSRYEYVGIQEEIRKLHILAGAYYELNR